MTTNMEIILYYACGSPVITPALKSWEFPLVKMSQKKMCEMWRAVRIQGFTVGLMTDEWNHYIKGNRGLSSTTANVEDMPACESTKCSRWPNKRANPSRNGNGESEMGHGTWRVRPRRIWPQPAWGWRCSSAHPSLQKKKKIQPLPELSQRSTICSNPAQPAHGNISRTCSSEKTGRHIDDSHSGSENSKP